MRAAASLLVLGICATASAAADSQAALPSFWPASGAANVCPDTPLRVTFSNPPALPGTGNISIIDASNNNVVEKIDLATPTAVETIGGIDGFYYHPLVADGDTLTIYPHDGALTYGKTYRVELDPSLPAGAASPTSWQFTTKPIPPAADSATITVAADGTGDFATVQGAIDFVPDGNTDPRTINIHKGTYTELICFLNKNNLHFRGEDRRGTIIQYANNDRFNHSSAGHVYHRGVFLAKGCNDLTLENLTIHDTTPQGGSQAEAIILNGSPTARAILRDVDLYSYQDTLQINGQAYLSNCYIEGDVDFMWGSGPCFFDNCECKALRSRAYYTQIRNTPKNHGYVYNHCTFDGGKDVKDVYLSRIAPARFTNSEVVLIDCTLTDAVNPIGWLLNGAKGQPPEDLLKDAANVHFWEFNSHNADGQPVDASKRLSISRQLTQPQDAKTIDDYSNPAFVLGNDWNPRGSATQPAP